MKKIIVIVMIMKKIIVIVISVFDFLESYLPLQGGLIKLLNLTFSIYSVHACLCV